MKKKKASSDDELYLFDKEEFINKERLQQRENNKGLKQRILRNDKKYLELKNQYELQSEELIRERELTAQLKADKLIMQIVIEDHARHLAEAIKDIENAETAMRQISAYFDKLPAGIAYSTFTKMSVLMADDQNWAREAPQIIFKIIEKLKVIEEFALSGKNLNNQITNSQITFKDAHFQGPMYDVNHNGQVTLGENSDEGK